jgi:hypothetical protein
VYKVIHRSATLKSHLKVHTDENTHTCKQRSKSFSQAVRLQIYSRIHTGETLYHSNQRDKLFSGVQVQVYRGVCVVRCLSGTFKSSLLMKTFQLVHMYECLLNHVRVLYRAVLGTILVLIIREGQPIVFSESGTQQSIN